jgi:hypothetical protein
MVILLMSLLSTRIVADGQSSRQFIQSGESSSSSPSSSIFSKIVKGVLFRREKAQTQPQKQQRKKGRGDNKEVLPCTYEQLEQRFSMSKETTTSSCWNLNDEMLHVPVDAIINRHNMKQLGAGINGVVHRVHIAISNTDICSAVVKTDPCKSSMDGRQELFYQSCIAPNTLRMNNSTSMGSDYLAALVWTAARKVNRDLPGLIPTWGVVDTVNTTSNTVAGMIDPAVSVGVILPLMDLKAFDTIFLASQDDKQDEEELLKRSSPIQVANLILPIAEAYEFVANMGLSTQYVHERDIGILATSKKSSLPSNHAHIFINTNLSFRNNATCAIPGQACNFCDDPVFARFHIQEAFSGEMVRRKDCRRFMKMMLHFGDFNRQHKDPLYRDMDYKLFSGENYSMSDIVEIIQARISNEEFCLVPTKEDVGNTQATTKGQKPGSKSDVKKTTRNNETSARSGHNETMALAVEDIGDVVPCTYDLLSTMFLQTKKRHTSSGVNESQCWSLKNEILHIPRQAVINRNGMKMLGKGTRGVVYEGFIRGPSGNVCSVAIKTDKCKLGEKKKKKLNRSCIEDGTKLMAGYQSYISSEYMGALLFVAARKAGVDLPGFLPTWGIISNIFVDADSIEGVLMPIVKFETVEDIWENSENAAQKTPLEVANLMLSVTKALSFVADLGLSFQDVHQKNIGILDDGSMEMAFIYDNTYLSFLKGETCMLPQTLKEACNFCVEETFTLSHRPETFSGKMIKRKDCGTALAITWRWLNFYGNGEEELAKSIDFMLHATTECTFDEVVNLLQEYIAQKEAEAGKNSENIQPSLTSSRWSSLPANVQNAWTLLGYDEELWDDGEEPLDKSWDELSSEQKQAARFLGFDKLSWDSDSDKELDASIFFSQPPTHTLTQ